ncbi:MAG TPA: hypothetical protein VL551_15940 [Actinospica sp.]|jgi:hypothetical protein|nr:hypothetical protein [Actinospica sp.]
MKLKHALAVTLGGAALVTGISVGTASAAGPGYFDSVSNHGCSANRYLVNSTNQYTYYTITGNGSSIIECTFWMIQNGSREDEPPGFNLYDGPGFTDQICAYAYNIDIDRGYGTVCDTPY